jgi:hypothetical protein
MTGPNDTSAGGVNSAFPTTRWSTILTAKDQTSPQGRTALEDLCSRYWKPVYAYIRSVRTCTNEEGKDLTQQFFTQIIERNLVGRFTPTEGTFRNYVRGAVRLFLREHHRKTTAIKRGGRLQRLSLDDPQGVPSDKLASPTQNSPDDLFDRLWADSVLDGAIQELQQELGRDGREDYFHIFDRYELNPSLQDPPTYAGLAREFQVKETDIITVLRHCRRRMRTLILEHIRDTVATEAEAASELFALFQHPSA